MDPIAPSAAVLARLPLRAVAAYAARVAAREGANLSGIVRDGTLEAAVQSIRAAALAVPGTIDPSSVVAAASEVVGEYAVVPSESQTADRTRAVLTFVQSSVAAASAIGAINDPADAPRYAMRAAKAAARSASHLGGAEQRAARDDYELLAQEFGEHDAVSIGRPVDFALFDRRG